MTSSNPTTPRRTPQSTRTLQYESFNDLFQQSPTSPLSRSILQSSPTTTHTRRVSQAESLREDGGDGEPVGQVERSSSSPPRGDNKLTTWDLINLTLGLAGAQLTWTVEMAYGTPYLLELGLTKQGTSLVWMAGPLSGLLIQPLVGALSDASTSKYRRRFYIALSALLILISTLVVAFAREISSVLCSLGGMGDWDPQRRASEQTVAIWIGVVGFYVLDFSLNGLQATMRALVLDLVPSQQQNLGNAWLGRQTHIANIFGYLCGFFDLGSISALKWIGGGQFRRLGVISCLVMSVTVAVTCVTQEEEKRTRDEEEDEGSAIMRLWADIKESIRDLPIEVRRVCYVQFFAWTAWFPFLFYATTYVAEELYASIPRNQPLPSADDATRAGSLALLIYAIVSLTVGTFLPYLTTLGDKPFIQRRLSYSTKFGRTGRWILSLMTPKNCWTIGLWSYVVGCVGTFFVTGPKGAMVFVAFQGIAWAVTCWVPFALCMEYIREDEIPSSSLIPPDSQSSTSTPTHSPIPTSSSPFLRHQPFRASNRQQSFLINNPLESPSPSSPRFPSTSQPPHHERSPLLRRQESALSTRSARSARSFAKPTENSPPRGGIVLGIHNLSIVAPQFLVAIVAALIFKLTSSSTSSSDDDENALLMLGRGLASLWIGNAEGDDELKSKGDVVWVLRFGGLAAIGGAIASRWIIAPRSEREYVKRVLYGGEESDRDGDQEEDRDEREERGEREYP